MAGCFFSLLGLVGGIVGLVYVIIPSILNFDPDKLMWLIGISILFLLVWIIGIYLAYDSWGNYFYYKGWKKILLGANMLSKNSGKICIVENLNDLSSPM